MNLLKVLLAGKLAESQPGPGGTIDGSLDTNSTNAVQNKAIAAALLQMLGQLEDKADKETVVEVSGTTVEITPEPDHDYQCGEPVSLTITDPPPSGIYSIVFTSGSTPTVVNWSTIRWPGDVAPTIEANTEYEIIVSDNRGVYNDGWPLQTGE